MALTSASATSYLASQLFGSSKSALSSLYNSSTSSSGTSSSVFAKDSRGRAILPTMDSLNKATKPADKLSLAYQMANVVKISTDAATRTQVVTRLGAMTNQTQQVLSAVETAVSGLKGQTNGLKNNEGKISSTVSALRGVMSQIGKLMDKLPTAEAKQVKITLVDMDSRLAKIANTAGLKYTSLFKQASGTASSAAASSRIVDYTV